MKANLHALSQSLGLSPTTADLQAASEKRQQDLVAARQNKLDLTVARDAAYDTGTPAAIQKATAALADAEITEGRCQLAYAASERRLNAAREAEASKAREAAIVKRDAAVTTFTKSAAELDRLAKAMATNAAAIDALYPTLNECRRDGVAGPFVPTSGAAMAEFSLLQAVASQNGEYTGNRTSAAEAAARVTGAVMAVTA